MTKLAICTLALASGCQLAQVDVQVEELRLTYHDVAIMDAHGLSSARKGFTFDNLGALKDIVDDGAQISFVGIELRASSGVDSLAFVDGMDLVLGSGDQKADLPALMVSTCNGNCKVHDASLELPAEANADATPYIRTGSLKLDVAVRGRMPTKDWAFDLDVVLQGTFDYRYTP